MAKAKTGDRIAELEKKLEESSTEIKNCHILIGTLAARLHGAVVLTDREMTTVAQTGELSVRRDDAIPGCIILVRGKPQAEAQN